MDEKERILTDSLDASKPAGSPETGSGAVIDDLVAFLDGSVGKGVGHINVDTDDKVEEAVNVETMGCTDCSRTPLACSVPTLHQGLDDYS